MMKKFFLLIFLLLLFNNHCYSQHIESALPKIDLDYVGDIGIKMDGYCVYYTYDSLDLHTLKGKRRAILAINKLRQIAIIKIADKSENIFLKGGNSYSLGSSRDTSTYTGNGYTIKLNTHIVKEEAYHIKYKGAITLTYQQKDTTIKVRGILVE